MTVHFGPDKATFIHIPKCAGTSIKKWATQLPQVTNGPKHIKSRGAKRRFQTPGRLFCVVRNPYDRAVSLFHFCGQLGTGEINLGGKRPAVYDVWREAYPLGLLHFLKRIADHDLTADTSDPDWHHWDSQWSWIHDDPDAIVLRHENLVEDFGVVQDLLDHHEPLPLVNNSRHDHYDTYLDNEIKKLIQDIWQEDFERFGYQP